MSMSQYVYVIYSILYIHSISLTHKKNGNKGSVNTQKTFRQL